MSTGTNNKDFWVWSPYSTVPGRAFVTEIGGLGDDTARRLLNGEKLARVQRLAVRNYEPGSFGDVLGAYIGLLIVSPALVAVLKAAARADLQLLPVSVVGKPELEYFVVNVLSTVPAIDVDRSVLTTFAGTQVIDRVSRLELRQIPDSAPPIFHAAEHPVLVLVNDELRCQLQAASRHAGVLTRVQDWRNHD